MRQSIGGNCDSILFYIYTMTTISILTLNNAVLASIADSRSKSAISISQEQGKSGAAFIRHDDVDIAIVIKVRRRGTIRQGAG